MAAAWRTVFLCTALSMMVCASLGAAARDSDGMSDAAKRQRLEKDLLVDLDDYPEWARTPLLILANKNFLAACGVMFVIFLPNMIWGGSVSARAADRQKRL